ncbi:MAG: hypothetical protein M1376_21115, partial [Planctomycetes bacterium]|nr:hypothetical protein [Planctomycetota bacterium]
GRIESLRGNERRANLRDERDREGFLTRLGQCGERHYLRNRGQPLISGEQGQGHILNYKLFVVIMG